MLGRLSAFVGFLKRPSVLSTTSVGVVNGNNHGYCPVQKSPFLGSLQHFQFGVLRIHTWFWSVLYRYTRFLELTLRNTRFWLHLYLFLVTCITRVPFSSGFPSVRRKLTQP